MKLTLDNERLRLLIPNIIHEVEGETPLFDKLLPWLTSARLWMEEFILGEFQPENGLYELAEKIIVYKAFAEAVPSLDVTLSPAGFAVINTDGRAPASKERVERIVASLSSFVDANLAVLVRELHRCLEWVASSLGVWFRATFIPDFTDVPGFRTDKDMLTTYKTMRGIALEFERELEENISAMTSSGFCVPLSRDLRRSENWICLMQSVAPNCVTYPSTSPTALPKCPEGHEVWHLARPIVARLNYWPELKALWEQEMGEKIKVEPFKNTVRGGFYF